MRITLKNNEERLNYIKDKNNWEEIGSMECLKDRYGKPVFKVLRLNGTDVYCISACEKEVRIDLFVEGFGKKWSYRGGFFFVLDRDGKFDRILNIKEAIIRLKESGLRSVEWKE